MEKEYEIGQILSFIKSKYKHTNFTYNKQYKIIEKRIIPRTYDNECEYIEYVILNDFGVKSYFQDSGYSCNIYLNFIDIKEVRRKKLNRINK